MFTVMLHENIKKKLFHNNEEKIVVFFSCKIVSKQEPANQPMSRYLLCSTTKYLA